MSPTDNNKGEDWSPEKYNKHASFVYSKEFTTPVLSMLNPQPGEKIIDFGCGSGELTVQLQSIVGESGLVIGVDSSQNMVEKARQNGVVNCSVADIQSLSLPFTEGTFGNNIQSSFDYKFDAVFSNAALHWCKQSPRGAIESAAKALKKGGRFVAEMGGFTNCIGLIMAIHAVVRKRGYDPIALSPWYFPSVQEYRKLLESSGFEVKEITLNPRFTPLTTDIIGWQQTFCRNVFYANMSDEEAESIMKEVQDMCEVDMKDSEGNWALMYTRLRFVAFLK
ncbi:S-adenosyl-L-methionine-dependent methyltransferase [Schizopora paradoxa]|uniref:S-adenosyl-L-methionine-dependent methyltransferase n=1 Tax=Schizopora paradoxa TaxID=27342 RepID=A0A0H2RYV3_9AGAM|nr:S-adenosyl-L-methionine-dependent methyltransferase [Schizopora paradoxa]